MKRDELTSAGAGAPGTGKPGTGKDAKAAAKAAPGKAPAKGSAPVEDKNAPKPIEIEYDEVEKNPEFIVLEKDFMIHVKKNTVKDAVVGPKSSKAANSNLSADDKRANRLTELKSEFQIVRALPFSM